MSRFYLLPPRSVLADHLAYSLARFLPGLDCSLTERQRLVEVMLDAFPLPEEVFVLFRDELPEGAAPERILIEGYGAEPGDEVLEVQLGQPDRRWRISNLACRAA